MVDGLIGAALREAARREKKREKAELRRARKANGLPSTKAGSTTEMGVATTEAGGATTKAVSGMCADGGESLMGTVRGVCMADWMSQAVGSLLEEMEKARLAHSEEERASRRLLAIEASEKERMRRLAELDLVMREEEGRREVMRAAARAARPRLLSRARRRRPARGADAAPRPHAEPVEEPAHDDPRALRGRARRRRHERPALPRPRRARPLAARAQANGR